MWLGMFFGAGVGLGVVLVVLGVLWGRVDAERSGPAPRPEQRFGFDLSMLADKVNVGLAVLALVAAIVAGFLTRWPALAYGAAVMVYGIPTMLGSDSSVTRYADQTENIAAWVEDIRAAINSGSLLESAVRSATSTAGPGIRPDLVVMVGELEHGVSLRDALINMAERVDHRIMDQVVAVMVLVTDGGGAAVSGVLTDLAANCREMTTAALQVHAARATNRTQTRMMLLASLILLATFTFVARDLGQAYATNVGQGVLAVLITGFGGVFVWISRLAAHRPPVRVLSPEGLR